MTILGKTDGASGQDGTSYLDIVNFIRANGSNPGKDLIELWKRIVFNMAITNSDDHLRNHAFLLKQKGWELSPLYDVNPVPYGKDLSLNVSENDSSISFELAVEVSPFFGIDSVKAEAMVNEISSTIRENWEKLATQYGISRAEIENMRAAFHECYKQANRGQTA